MLWGLLLLLLLLPAPQGASWSHATDGELQKIFSTQERCALDPSLSHSPSCRRNVEAQVLRPSLPRQCQVGFVRKDISTPHNQQQRKSCRSRGFADRAGLRYSWKNLLGDNKSGSRGHESPEKDTAGTIDLAKSLFSQHLLRIVERGSLASGQGSLIQNIVFLGDSVSSQLAQFLICDLLRQKSDGLTNVNDESSKDGNQWTVKTFNRSVASFDVRFGSPLNHSSGMLHIHNQQFNLPCLQNNRSGKCHLPREQAVFNYVSSLIDPYVALTLNSLNPSFVHTAIVFNYGLHIHHKYAWTVKPMLMALWHHARSTEHHGVSFFFRETSTQSFTGSPGGYFKYDMVSYPDQFCCSRPSPKALVDDLEWRNRLVRQELDKLDHHWSRFVHWLPFFDISAELWDLRAEWNAQTALPDCTHFIYSPLAFSPLWRALHNALINCPPIERHNA